MRRQAPHFRREPIAVYARCIIVALLWAMFVLASTNQVRGQAEPTLTPTVPNLPPTETPISLPEITYGQILSGVLAGPDGDSFYQFTGRQGDSIALTLEMPNETLNPILMVLDISQTRLIAIEKGSSAQKIRLRMVILNSGTYALKITTLRGASNIGVRFTIGLTLQNPTPTPSPLVDAPIIAPLPVGSSIRADLNELVRFRLYPFAAHRGDPIRVRLEMEDGLQGSIYLYSSDFSTLLNTALLGQQLELTAPEDGLFWLVVARSAAAGAFTLHVDAPTQAYEGKPLGFDPPRIVPGVSENVSLGPRFAVVYRFEALSGMQASLNLINIDNLPTTLILADGRFQQLASGAAYVTGPVFAKYDTAYVIVARQSGPMDTSSGRVTLNFSSPLDTAGKQTILPAPTQLPTTAPMTESTGGPLTLRYGDTVTGAVSKTQFVAYYTFQGVQGETVSIRMKAGAGSFLDPALYLYGYPSNQPVLIASAANGGEASLRKTLPNTGTFLIIATRRGAAQGTTEGTFVLTLTREN